MLSRLRALLSRHHPAPPPVVQWVDGGFALYDTATVTEVRWTAVRRAAAYKRDLYTTDCIVLALELDPPAPTVLEIPEDAAGFATLFDGMERALGVSPAWYAEIMTPAFAPTPRVLYERPIAPPLGSEAHR